MPKSIIVIILIALVLVMFAGCAPGANSFVEPRTSENEVAGFWMGLWHGFISPVTFIISLFSKTVSVYEVHNNGNWYNFGFLIGASAIFGGGGGGAARSRRKRG